MFRVILENIKKETTFLYRFVVVPICILFISEQIKIIMNCDNINELNLMKTSTAEVKQNQINTTESIDNKILFIENRLDKVERRLEKLSKM